VCVGNRKPSNSQGHRRTSPNVLMGLVSHTGFGYRCEGNILETRISSLPQFLVSKSREAVLCRSCIHRAAQRAQEELLETLYHHFTADRYDAMGQSIIGFVLYGLVTVICGDHGVSKGRTLKEFEVTRHQRRLVGACDCCQTSMEGRPPTFRSCPIRRRDR
jgi:hypothetical protein